MTQPTSLSVTPSDACICGMATLTIDVSTISSSAPSATLMAISQRRVLSGTTAPAIGMAVALMRLGRATRVDGELDRKAGQQHQVGGRVVQLHPHPPALHDLGEVAGGVGGREQRKARALASATCAGSVSLACPSRAEASLTRARACVVELLSVTMRACAISWAACALSKPVWAASSAALAMAPEANSCLVRSKSSLALSRWAVAAAKLAFPSTIWSEVAVTATAAPVSDARAMLRPAEAFCAVRSAVASAASAEALAASSSASA